MSVHGDAVLGDAGHGDAMLGGVHSGGVHSGDVHGGGVHGGFNAADARTVAGWGLDPETIIDLSASLHPAGPHPAVLAAARGAAVDRYPDPRAEPLRRELAERLDLSPQQVLVTAGATDALHLAARALLAPGDRCALFPPTFGEYEAAVLHAGARPLRRPAVAPDFRPDLDIAAGTPDAPVALAYLCNPNNPTGVVLPTDAVAGLVGALEGGVLVLDAAYEPFATEACDATALVRAGLRVLAVHAPTKLHAIPGLRIGYAVGPVGLIRRLEAIQPPWPVGGPAIAALREALRVDDAQRARLGDVAAVREALRARFTAPADGRPRRVAPGHANFVLAEVGDAAAFRETLLRHGFAVRDAASFGLGGWVRIAVPATEHLPALLAAVDAALRTLPAPAGGVSDRAVAS